MRASSSPCFRGKTCGLTKRIFSKKRTFRQCWKYIWNTWFSVSKWTHSVIYNYTRKLNGVSCSDGHVRVPWKEFSGRIVSSLKARLNRLRWLISSESPTHSHNLRKTHRDYTALPDRSAVEILIDSHSLLTLNLATQRLTSFELICLFFIEWTKRIVVCFRIFYIVWKISKKIGKLQQNKTDSGVKKVGGHARKRIIWKNMNRFGDIAEPDKFYAFIK